MKRLLTVIVATALLGGAGITAAPAATAAPASGTTNLAQATPTAVTIDPAGRNVSWKYPSDKETTFIVEAAKKPGQKAQRFTYQAQATSNGTYTYTLPWIAQGAVRVKAVPKSTVRTARVATSSWSENARTAFTTLVVVKSASATAGSSSVTVFTAAQNVTAAFSNSKDGANATIVSQKPARGTATLTTSGTFKYVTVTGQANGKTGKPVTVPTSNTPIHSLSVNELASDKVSLSWDNVGFALVTSVRRTEGVEPASNSRAGTAVSFIPGKKSVTDSRVKPGTTYTYTLFARGLRGTIDPVSVQVRTPNVNDQESWALAPGVATPKANDFTPLPAEEAAALPAPTVPSLVEGSTANLWIDYPAASNRDLVGQGVILPATKSLPGGFVGVVTAQRGTRIQLIQAPITSVITEMKASVTPVGTVEPLPQTVRIANKKTARVASAATPSSILGADCSAGYDITTFPLTGTVSNLNVTGDVDIDWASTNMWVQPTVDVAISGKAVSTSLSASCQFGLTIPDVPFALGPVPMLAKLDGNISANITVEQAQMGWEGKWRIGFYVRDGIGDDEVKWIADPISPAQLTYETEIGVSGSVGINASVVLGPGVGNELIGVVAGVTGSLGPRFDIGVEDQIAADESVDACLYVKLVIAAEAGVRAEVWAGPLSVTPINLTRSNEWELATWHPICWDKPTISEPVSPPSAPTDVLLVAGDKQLTVTWTESTNSPANYEVSIAESAAGPWVTKATVPAGTTTTSINDLTNFTPYWVKITAYNSQGASTPTIAGPKAPFSASGGSTYTPGAPSALTVQTRNEALYLSWGASTNVPTQYLIYYSEDAQNWTFFEANPASDRNSNITPLANGQRYWVRVVASNSSGVSGTATAGPFTPAPIPTVPTNVRAFASDDALQVNWSPTPSASRYIVRWRLTGTSTFGPITYVDAPATSFRITGLQNDKDYDISVAASNTTGASTANIIGPISPTGLVPARISDATGNAGDKEVALTWTAPADASGYKVRASGPDGNEAVTATSSSTISGLTNGVLYEFEVYGLNDSGRGASEIVRATPHQIEGEPLPETSGDAGAGSTTGAEAQSSVQSVTGPLPAPRGIAIEPGDGELHVSWRPVAEATEYRSVLTQGANTIYGPWGTDTEYVFTGLTNGALYTAGAQARNVAGQISTASTDSNASPTGDAPGAVTGLKAKVAGGQVVLTWNNASKATEYVVRMRVAGTSFTAISVASANGQTSTVGGGITIKHTMSNLKSGEQYSFSISSRNQYGWSGPTTLGPFIP